MLESVCDDYDFGGGKASHLNGIIAIMPKAQTVILVALLDTQNCLSLPGPHSRSRPHNKAGETQVPKLKETSLLYISCVFWIGLLHQNTLSRKKQNARPVPIPPSAPS